MTRFVAAVAVAMSTLGLTSAAHAFEVKKTTRGELVHWDTREVEYVIAPSLEEVVPGSVAATTDALADWSGAAAAPELRVRQATPSDPTRPSNDGTNGVYFMKGGYAPAGRALAVTVLTYDNASGRIVDADVVFNGAYKFAIHDAEGARPGARGTGISPTATDGVSHELVDARSEEKTTAYDLHHVVAHEIGHSLGMSDELGRRETLMYRYTTANDPGVRTPTSDDIAGLAELYSTELSAGGGGCGGATVSSRKPGAAASSGAMLATVSLLVFLALRARSSRRGRFVFATAAAVATLALVPSVSLSASGGESGVAQASTSAHGHARAKVVGTTTTLEDGLMRTTFRIATTACRAGVCPKGGHGMVWGGVSGNIVQEVDGQLAPVVGEDVDVSFAALPKVLSPVAHPLGHAHDAASGDVVVRALTRVAR